MAIRASGVTMAALVHGPGQPGRGADVGPGVSSVDLPLDEADVEFDRPSVSWRAARRLAYSASASDSPDVAADGAPSPAESVAFSCLRLRLAVSTAGTSADDDDERGA